MTTNSYLIEALIQLSNLILVILICVGIMTYLADEIVQPWLERRYKRKAEQCLTNYQDSIERAQVECHTCEQGYICETIKDHDDSLGGTMR